MRPVFHLAIAAAVGVISVGVSAGCSRTPPEPAPMSTTGSPTVAEPVTPRTSAPPSLSAESQAAQAAPTPSSKGDGGGRCIVATPVDAPPLPPPASASACPPDPEGIPKLPIAQVAFPDAASKPKVEVEIVKSDTETQRGLMYRMSMPEAHGMLFNLRERSDHAFWMHNTCLPLDMLFVDDDGLIVGIIEGATPLTDTTRSVGCPSTYVLEMNAGWCRRHGVRAGQKMGIPAAAR
jgi:uncharacterized membrane protein (UPF0127 family)